MTTGQKIFAGIAVTALVGAAVTVVVLNSRDDAVTVRIDEVERRDLVATVTASGNIRARRSVDMSSDISARVASLEVEEGDDVVEGQLLLSLDRSQVEAARSRAQALLSQARAQAAETRANLLQAQRAFDRTRTLYERDSVLVSIQQLEDAETTLEVARANLEAAEYGVQQAEASLEEADDQLSKTSFRAPISGRVTRLNVEEGETVVVGTMNNPGSLILTISDLSVVEAVVQVDETDVPELSLGDSARVKIDAFPETTFTGRVTEIGNSAILPPASQQGSQDAAIDFEVVITLSEPPVELRPDLSATADIITEVRRNVVSIPIIALTIRDREDMDGVGEDPADEGGGDDEEAPGDGEGSGDGGALDPSADDVEGVFLLRDGTVEFVPVTVGIAGAEHFEVLEGSGLAVGDTVVSGPYQVIRELDEGDVVQIRDADGAPEGG